MAGHEDNHIAIMCSEQDDLEALHHPEEVLCIEYKTAAFQQLGEITVQYRIDQYKDDRGRDSAQSRLGSVRSMRLSCSHRCQDRSEPCPIRRRLFKKNLRFLESLGNCREKKCREVKCFQGPARGACFRPAGPAQRLPSLISLTAYRAGTHQTLSSLCWRRHEGRAHRFERVHVDSADKDTMPTYFDKFLIGRSGDGSFWTNRPQCNTPGDFGTAGCFSLDHKPKALTKEAMSCDRQSCRHEVVQAVTSV